jgi:hypothetical protein
MIGFEEIAIIEELIRQIAGVSASPGFTWGRSGNVGSGTWLQNDTVPSNLAGRIFPLSNGQLIQLAVTNEGVNTFIVELYEHNGTTYTLLATCALTAVRSKVFGIADFGIVSITNGKELAIKVSSGSCKNPVVAGIFSGTFSP